MRTYADADGNTWMVYVVTPKGGASSPLPLPPGYEHGWLCFESTDLKRRLVPIPSDWESCNEARLEVYRAAAAVAPPRTLPTSDGRNAAERGGIAANLREIEHFFTRRLPASLSLVLDRTAVNSAQRLCMESEARRQNRRIHLPALHIFRAEES